MPLVVLAPAQAGPSYATKVEKFDTYEWIDLL